MCKLRGMAHGSAAGEVARDGVPAYELAQVNISRLLAPLDDPLLADFVANLDPVNAAAETADGFVWRFQDGDNATSVRVFDDDWLLVNMSTWVSQEDLLTYVYGAMHRAVLRRRREWFAKVGEIMTVLWWVPAGHRPTIAEAESKLLRLRTYGPSPEAFGLRDSYPSPDGIEPAAIGDVLERRPAECDA